jgi:hypothetical protein
MLPDILIYGLFYPIGAGAKKPHISQTKIHYQNVKQILMSPGKIGGIS